MRKLFNKEQEEFIRSNYQTMKYTTIANSLGFSERQVRGWINNHCDTKLRKFNSSDFEDTDTPEKAYWVGFIYADGYLIYSPERRTYELGMELQKEDKYILDRLNQVLGGQHKLYYKSQIKEICGHSPSKTESWVLRVYSKKIVEDLMRLGVHPCKTLGSEFPKIDEYFWDFLRGYFDGDGCFYVNRGRYPVVNITSSHREVLDYISNKLSEYKIKSAVYQEHELKYRLIAYNQSALLFCDKIYYQNHETKLIRKYSKYLKFLGLAA